MITVVFYEQYDSVLSERESVLADAIVDSDVLVITEDSDKAFKHIVRHMEDHPDDPIEYQIQFWLGEQVIGNAIIDSNVTIEQFNEEKENILALVKRSLH